MLREVGEAEAAQHKQYNRKSESETKEILHPAKIASHRAGYNKKIRHAPGEERAFLFDSTVISISGQIIRCELKILNKTNDISGEINDLLCFTSP